jgi:hypothetical protein
MRVKRQGQDVKAEWVWVHIQDFLQKKRRAYLIVFAGRKMQLKQSST